MFPAGTDMLVMAVSAAETETVSETEAASAEESTASGADEETEYPITIQHAYGETVIESKPERIATVGWENQDTPLALGIAPVGVSAANYGLCNRKQSASLDRRGLQGTGC